MDGTIPGDYIPVREAMVFRRTFLAEGEEAGKWRIPGPDGAFGVPTGVAAAPVCIEERADGAILAFRFAEGRWDEPAGQVLEMAAFLAARELARARRQHRMDRYLAEQEGLHLLVRKIAEVSEGKEGEDAEAAKDIVAIMRMGISHAMRLENLEREAKIDGLTGLLNRKTFHERLANVMSRMDGRYPCAVVMLDIDRFKRINDTFGCGGEEFAIYLHSIDEADAVRIAERLGLIIRQTRFVFGGKEVSVTASMGIACHPAHGMTGEELVRHADEALYRSKQGGRDRATVFIKQ